MAAIPPPASFVPLKAEDFTGPPSLTKVPLLGYVDGLIRDCAVNLVVGTEETRTLRWYAARAHVLEQDYSNVVVCPGTMLVLAGGGGAVLGLMTRNKPTKYCVCSLVSAH
jgi:hypothetical protein